MRFVLCSCADRVSDENTGEPLQTQEGLQARCSDDVPKDLTRYRAYKSRARKPSHVTPAEHTRAIQGCGMLNPTSIELYADI